MLRSCKYCGRIHDTKHDCGKKPKYTKNKEQDKFRSSYSWQKKREQIKERDLYLCRVCLNNNRVNYNDLSVHHIEPLERAWDKRLEGDNLITLCEHHHEKAENGEIPTELLIKLANSTPGGVGVENVRCAHTEAP